MEEKLVFCWIYKGINQVIAGCSEYPARGGGFVQLLSKHQCRIYVASYAISISGFEFCPALMFICRSHCGKCNSQLLQLPDELSGTLK